MEVLILIIVASNLLLTISLAVSIKRKENEMAATLDEISADVTGESTLIDSLSTLLSGLAAQVKAAAGDQTKIDAIFAAAESNKAKLATALAANTPAAPPAGP